MKILSWGSLIATVSLALLTGCKESGVTVDVPQPGLYGHVVDGSGTALANVDVHYIFYTTTNPVILNTWIQYSLPSAQVVTMKVFDPFGHEVQTVLDAQNQLAGSYTINVAPEVTNGIYLCKLQLAGAEQKSSFFIRTDDIALLRQRSPLVRSDTKGEFFLSPSTLGLGRRFPVRNADDEVIADSISVVLVRAGFQTLVQSVHMDTTQAISKTYVMTAD